MGSTNKRPDEGSCPVLCSKRTLLWSCRAQGILYSSSLGRCRGAMRCSCTEVLPSSVVWCRGVKRVPRHWHFDGFCCTGIGCMMGCVPVDSRLQPSAFMDI